MNNGTGPRRRAPGRQFCDHGDKAGNACPRPAKWVVATPHNDGPRYACQAHLGSVMWAAQLFYELTTTGPEFRVRLY